MACSMPVATQQNHAPRLALVQPDDIYEDVELPPREPRSPYDPDPFRLALLKEDSARLANAAREGITPDELLAHDVVEIFGEHGKAARQCSWAVQSAVGPSGEDVDEQIGLRKRNAKWTYGADLPELDLGGDMSGASNGWTNDDAAMVMRKVVSLVRWKRPGEDVRDPLKREARDYPIAEAEDLRDHLFAATWNALVRQSRADIECEAGRRAEATGKRITVEGIVGSMARSQYSNVRKFRARRTDEGNDARA